MTAGDEAVPGGAVYLPAHGVVVEDAPLEGGGLLFGTLDAERWSLLEANWMVDQESDRLAQPDRSVAVMRYEGVVDTADHPAFAEAFRRYQRVASTGRLAGPGTWVDA